MHQYTYCGLDCYNCEYKDKCKCRGCRETLGEPFHGSCELAKCAIAKNVEYCSLCSEFPCSLLKDYSYDPVHGDNGKRIVILNNIVKETI